MVVLFVCLCVFVIILSRVRADHVGVSVQLGPWKVLTSLPPGSLLVSEQQLVDCDHEV
jgi:hypothetical protein